ncbi:MAG TPA: histidine kinase [Gemmatimonadales bacterium]|nr:histidine kinase [Gemmatimonadales bacterium]
MQSAWPEPIEFNTSALLEAFFERSQDGFFFMMLDQPIEWGPGVDKDAVLDYVFAHQRMTKVNPAMAKQFRAIPEALIGLTPNDFFRHDVAAGRRGWRDLFDAGHTHSVTNERRLDGSTMWVEGDYMCFYDAEGHITGHFGIQRDVTDRTRAAEELEQSRAELRALAARLQAIREEERTRIAREIHDELGQALTALKLDLAWVSGEGGPKRSKGGRTSEQLRAVDESITERIDQTMEIVRRIASELRPSVLDQLGLEAAIEYLVQDTSRRTGMTVTLDAAQEFPRLPDDIASHAFRIIQEALTNVTRHSKATRVEVAVRRAGGTIILGVADNGVGFVPDSISGLHSLGLVGMRERALACGGVLMVQGKPGEGTSIVVTIPVKAP